MKDFIKFIDDRQKCVNNDVIMIADEYINNGEKAALAILNGLISANDLKVWEASVLESKVCRELTNRGVFSKVSDMGEQL